MDTIVSLSRRRGFVFPSSEIYGGLGSAYDYAHYGVLMKGNVKAAWLRAMVQERDDIVALDSALMLQPEGLGGLGPRRRVLRPDGRLPRLQAPLPRRRSRERDLPAEAEQAPGPGPELRSHRGARLQPHVRDDDRAGQGVGHERLPPPRDRAGHLHQLQERAADRAPQAAVRHRAGRQVVPQRDHARQLPLPHARVRADGDGVLRAARAGRRVVRLLGRASAATGTTATASSPRTCACACTRPRSSRTTRAPRATSSTGTRSAGPSSRASRTAATTTSRSTAEHSGAKLEVRRARTASATSRT